jgi:hypothetical protein
MALFEKYLKSRPVALVVNGKALVNLENEIVRIGGIITAKIPHETRAEYYQIKIFWLDASGNTIWP